MKKIKNSLDRIISNLVVFILGLMVVVVSWQVVVRYLFSSPSKYSDELAGFLLIWLGLLGAAYVLGEKGHLAIDTVSKKLNGKSKKIAGLAMWGLILFFSLMVIGAGGAWLVYTRFVLEVTSSVLGINLGYVYLALPISGLVMSFYSVVEINYLKNA